MCLCIGGSQDGKHLDFDPDSNGLTVPVPPRVGAVFVGPSDPMAMPSFSSIEAEHYWPHKWHVQGRTFVLLAPGGLTGEQVFESLIAGYRNRGGEKS